MNAPIALFVFNRPLHTLKALESLAANSGFSGSPLYIFCDGTRHDKEADAVEEVRHIVHRFEHPNKIVIENPCNLGLANSIIKGVSQLCDKYGKVIVVEDDLFVSPMFLDYMNCALDYYADDQSVMQISGHMFPVDLPCDTDAVFLPFTTSWGWATWQRAWEKFDPDMTALETLKKNRAMRIKFDLDGAYPYYRMLRHQQAGQVDSWAIRWYLSVFLNNGIVLYPTKTMVNNMGFDGTGTNCDNRQTKHIKSLLGQDRVVNLPIVELNEMAFTLVKHFLRSENSLLARVSRVFTRSLKSELECR